MPTPITNWEGINNVNNVHPPDTQGDVGPNHYIQWVNLSFAIWNKSGTLLYGPANGNTLWSGFGGPCESTNDGDPITLYDHLADRWLMSQFALPNYPNGPFYQCFAISQSPDPLGSWYRYQFTWPNNYLNDYPKIGVWPDGYYISVNQFAANSFQWRGAGVAAFERSQMLQGQPAQWIYFNLYTVDPDYGGLLPSDLDGATQPPAGAPNYFASWDDSTWGVGPNDAVHIWAFHVDWTTPANSTFGDANHFPNWTLNTNNIDPNMCNYARNCIPEPGGYYLDAISDRLMYRLQYRNFGSYESMVCNRTVDTGGDHAGIYWFEVRKTGADWSLYQQGIYSPDSIHRWMGSIAQDRQGNMALGFSVSSSTVYPGIRYVGRLATDPLDTMPQSETVLWNGSGSQTSNYYRWGDYSMMGVDPVDDCTFWYTQEYIQTTGYAPWQTRIGSFRFPGCVTGPTPTPTPTPTNTPTPTSTPTPTPTNTPTPGPSPTPTPTPPFPPPESGGEQAPECMDDPAGTLVLPGPIVQGVPGFPAERALAGTDKAVRMATVLLKEAAATELEATELRIEEPVNPSPSTEISPPVQAPEAVAPIPNIKVEGLPNSSEWVTSVADNQGNLYTAFEYPYATGCGSTCYAVIAGKSRDNGKTWDLWYVVASATASARRPSIAVDNNGKLYIAMELYFNGVGGLRWYAAVATSDCPCNVSSWSITYWNTTYALAPGGTDADAGGDGNDFYAQFQVPFENDGQPDLLTVWSLDGGVTWSGGFLYATGYPLERPTTQVGTANMSCSFYYNNATRYWYYGTLGANCTSNTGTSRNGASYADGDGSGAYHYVVYQRRPASNDNIYIRYSTNDGVSFSSEVGVDTTALNQTYPAVSGNGNKVRVAYIHNANQTRLQISDNNGQTWLGTPYTLNTGGNTTVNGFHYVALAYHPIGGTADGKHPIAFWVDNRDSGAGQGNNIYLGTINDPPPVATLSWPASGATITAFAPSLRWNAGTDPDGDTLRYWWYVDTANPPTNRVGGPIALTTALPYYTDPGTTYYWKVVADDGYQTSADSAVWSFTTANEILSGSPATYSEGFASDPPYWTRSAFACLDCFEGDPIRWTVSPAGKWIRSTDYAWSGTYSAHALYDANNADYQMTSPALDLRGTSWAFFNTHFRGSSEQGYDYLYLESRPSSTSSCWTMEDARSGNYNTGWWVYYEGNVDLTAYAGSTTSQSRFRFNTDDTNYGGSYGVGWYEDEVEVDRESAWAWRNASPYYYRLQTQGSFVGYTNNLVDQFYSPYVQLPNNAGYSIRLVLTERYDIAAGDYATVWIRDATADTWQKLASYNGSQNSWNDRVILIPDSYKGRVVVIALVLHTDSSGTLGGVQETGGYWDIDTLLLEEYAPTAVKLLSFQALPEVAGVRLTWETANEWDNLGFNLYRSTSLQEKGEKINATLIPSRSPGGGEGASYDFLDTAARPGQTYFYMLEDVDLSGRRTSHGPAAIAYRQVYLPLVWR